MKHKNILLLVTNILIYHINCSPSFHKVHKKEILIYDQFGSNFEFLAHEFKKFGIEPKRITQLDRTNSNLHIICDATLVPFVYFPSNYIIFQNLNLNKIPLTKNYFEKLRKATAIWDSKWSNITQYCLLLDNYYFLPKNSDLTDPIFLPCCIPPEYLTDYKEVLSYSNSNDSDISSHLPIIFCHAILQKPNLIIEVGIRSGESSFIFNKISKAFNTKLIGIDINEKAKSSYDNLKNKKAIFLTMNDIDFPAWLEDSEFKNSKADIIFIDTSHYYDQTVKELNAFVPLLENNGLLIFHDTNMCSKTKNTYYRLNNTNGIGWDNEKGVVKALKEFFNIDFNEESYNSLNFSFNNINWRLLHYPFCNGLTIIKKLN